MSGILECEGVFQVPLADGWTVRGEPGRAYDISHDTLGVAVTISVYSRAAIGADLGAAVSKLASTAGADPADVSVAEVPAADHDRVAARFDAGDSTWLVSLLIIGSNAVLVTSNSERGDEAAEQAGLLVVGSVGPTQRHRRFGRRRQADEAPSTYDRDRRRQGR